VTEEGRKMSRDVDGEQVRGDVRPGGTEESLKARNGDPLKGEFDNAMKRLGKLTMENELLWARVRRPSPLAQRRSRR
jgi:hypothetical protein